MVAESVVQERPAGSSTTAVAAAWIVDQSLRLRVVLDGWCRRCATTVELSTTARSAALVVWNVSTGRYAEDSKSLLGRRRSENRRREQGQFTDNFQSH